MNMWLYFVVDAYIANLISRSIEKYTVVKVLMYTDTAKQNKTRSQVWNAGPAI